MNETDRRTVLFTAAAHGLVHTYELSIPILLTVWLVEFSTTAATLGLIVTIGYGLFGVGALPGGILVDRYGSKPLIIACLAGMAGSFLLLSVSISIATLAVAIALWGVTASVYHPAGLSLLSTSVERPGVAFGYHGIGGNLGIALGPLAVALLLLQFDWRFVTTALAVPALVVIGFGMLVDVESRERTVSETDQPETESKSNTKGRLTVSAILQDSRTLLTVGFALVIVIVTMSGLYYRAFLTFLPDLLSDLLDGLVDIQLVDPESPYAEEFDLARYFYVAILVFGVFGQYLGGYLAERFAVEKSLAVVLVALATLALLFVPASGSAGPFVVVSLLLGVVLFTIQPLQQAAVAKHSPPETRGLSFGYTFLAIFGVGALGAGLAGTILTLASVRELFLVLGGIALTGAAVTALLFQIESDRR